MTDWPEKMGETIKNRRMEIGMTQKQFGALLGFTNEKTVKSMISQIEAGKRTIPVSKFRTAAEALGITLEELIP